jgi:DNA invertase Pin-like site-specific DNA recombinase
MNTSNGKVQLDHLQRLAYVYIRQSTLQQVHHHQESGRRQYALQDQALALGWSCTALVVVDEDQGRSGQDTERAGFRRLMEAVARSEVGAIFCLEVSRLARRSSLWHALVELCAWHNTLLVDEDGIYDPNLANDRLLLGIRGLVDENELTTLRRRMQVSREEKAQRGELKVQPPTGFAYDYTGHLCLDPDEEVQGTLRLFFDQFRRLGSAAAVVRYFAARHLRFPTRHVGGVRDGEVTWKPLTYGRALYVLHDPIYAGAYVYGRHAHGRQRKPREKQHQREVRLPQEQWLVLIWDAFPAYISHEEYEVNQRRLQENRSTDGTSGVARSGAALLSGQVLCGVCGRPMRVAYEGTDGQYVAYICYPEWHQGRYHACQRVPGAGVDQSVVQVVLQTLTPAEIELGLQVLETITQQQEALRRQWERRLERARYEADLARRRYRQVDPENRLVARTLEREWEESLIAFTEVEQAYTRAQQETPLMLDEEARAHLLALAHDLPALWEAESTTWAERKELLRLLIADVTLTRQETDIVVQLRWVTNQVDTWTVPLPQRGARTDPVVIERLRELNSYLTDTEIAARLNAEGLCTARGRPFTGQRVHSLRRTYRIVKVQRPSQVPD